MHPFFSQILELRNWISCMEYRRPAWTSSAASFFPSPFSSSSSSTGSSIAISARMWRIWSTYIKTIPSRQQNTAIKLFFSGKNSALDYGLWGSWKHTFMPCFAIFSKCQNNFSLVTGDLLKTNHPKLPVRPLNLISE